MEIHHLCSKFKLNASWVKAHQDNTTPIENFSLKSQLNVMADADAKKNHLNAPTSLTPIAAPIIVPSNTAYLQINKVAVTNNIPETIRSASVVTGMEHYVKKKTRYNKEQMDSADWDSLGSTPQRQMLNNQIRLVKFMNNWLNTGQQKQKLDEFTFDCCPVCGNEEET
eukprot:15327239-Ditylum_brightwellii.AAC.2